MSRKARATQNQAMISLLTLAPMGMCASFSAAILFFAWVASAFTVHRYGFRSFTGLRTFGDLELHEIRGIDAGVAGGAKLAFGVADSLAKIGQREITERIGAEKFANLLRRVGRGDQFLFCGRVDTVVAGRNGWRTTDAHVNFCGAGFANHANKFATGGAANDGIIDENDALAGDEATHGIEFEFYAKITDG